MTKQLNGIDGLMMMEIRIEENQVMLIFENILVMLMVKLFLMPVVEMDI